MLLLLSTERQDTITYVPLVDDASKELLSKPQFANYETIMIDFFPSSPLAKLEQLSYGKNAFRKMKKNSLSQGKSSQQQTRHGATTPVGKAKKKT